MFRHEGTERTPAENRFLGGFLGGIISGHTRTYVFVAPVSMILAGAAYGLLGGRGLRLGRPP